MGNHIRLIPLSAKMELEQAEKIRRTNIATSFERGIILESEIMDIKIPETKFILKGLIAEKTINIINGFRNYGKSWFVMAIANEVTWEGKIGPWKVEQSVNTLLVDGEMPLSMIQDRLRHMNIERSNIMMKPSHLFIYPESFAYRIGLRRANLLDIRWRERIAEEIIRNEIELVILDNLSSLAPGIDENDKMQFDPINRWMLELRFHGVTIILTHHVGKSGDQRGTTAHEDHLDTALILDRPTDYKKSDGCKFIAKITKDRGFLTKGNQYVLQLCKNENGRLEFATCLEIGIDGACIFLEENPNATEREAAESGISPRTFYRAKEKLNLMKKGSK